MKMLDFTEPFTALVNQGQVINQGKAMSKSLGDGVNLGEQLAAHGVDAIRLTMIFASPPEDDIDWAESIPTPWSSSSAGWPGLLPRWPRPGLLRRPVPRWRTSPLRGLPGRPAT